ncbi:PP2C family protein-serine/threonine phosphatase [Rugosimonospora acidiphila]
MNAADLAGSAQSAGAAGLAGPAPSVILRAVVLTDRGLRRDSNEDAAYAGQRLIVLADGVGGLPGGEVASQIAVETLSGLDRQLPSGQGALDALQAAVEVARARIGEASVSDPSLTGMSTTLTGMLMVADRITMVHIGDSRAYLLRGGVLGQLTRDDSYVQMLIDEGAITPEQARVHPQRSLVSQVLQDHPARPAYTVLRPDPGDRFLLCSDGLSDVVEDGQIGFTLRTVPDRDECARELVRLALDGGGPDNITVVVADVYAAANGDAAVIDDAAPPSTVFAAEDPPTGETPIAV